MALPNHTEVARLTLRVERDLVAQAHLRTLLNAAVTTLAQHRKALRLVRARIRRTQASG